MADDQVRITVIVSRPFKREVKKALAEKGYDKDLIGYKKIFELGLLEFKKLKEV